MRALIIVHRWLGVAFCLLFAMWFATGIVMHFVPYPALTETERVAGLAVIDTAKMPHGPGAAVTAAKIPDATRVRLRARSDGLVYLVRGASGISALHAEDLTPAGVQSEILALVIATDHARRRGMNANLATVAELADYDQWTVSNGLDLHRPLYRIALNDVDGTELYVSSTTGEVVRDTTRNERWWNYAGSVAHWIYPTVLRRDQRAWSAVVWTLSLIALIAAISGALVGTLRINMTPGRIASPFQGWQMWHHWLGLGCMCFLLTWIFSGWLSMDNGWLFSNGRPSAVESMKLAGMAAWERLPAREIQLLPAQAREVEWFAFDGQIYRRERLGPDVQRLSLAGDIAGPGRAYLEPTDVTAAVRHLAPDCKAAVVVPAGDDYPVEPVVPGTPVYRSVCGEVWFHIDGSSGAMSKKLDASRRAYRWAYGALHTLDFPALAARPALRTALIVMLCGLGMAFSLTAVVIGWRRLRRDFCTAGTRKSPD